MLLGNGNGTFQSAVSYAVPEGPISAAVGDFNHDGKLDLAVALNKVNGTATGTGVSVLLGTGDGTFQAAVTYNITGLSEDPSRCRMQKQNELPQVVRIEPQAGVRL